MTQASDYNTPATNLDGTPYKLPLFIRRKNIQSIQVALKKTNGNMELITLLNHKLAMQRKWMYEDWGVKE